MERGTHTELQYRFRGANLEVATLQRRMILNFQTETGFIQTVEAGMLLPHAEYWFEADIMFALLGIERRCAY